MANAWLCGRIRRPVVFFFSLFLAQTFFLSSPEAGRRAAGSAGREESIAIGKPYVLKPAPDHSAPMDSQDAFKLTDGRRATGYFFSDAESIGWRSTQTLIVTIDLSTVQAVSGASFSTAAGAEGVEWPRSIRLLVSDDDKSYFDAGDLTVLSARHGDPPDSCYAAHKFWTRELKTYGRFVTFVVSGRSPIFVDELEVYGENGKRARTSSRGEPIGDLKAFFKEKRIEEAVRGRLQQDLRDIGRSVAGSALANREKSRIAEKLQAVRRELIDPARSTGMSPRSVLPLNRLHRRLFEAQAMLWRSMGLPDLILWGSGPWDPLSHTQTPPVDSEASIDIKMMSNEHRAGVVNISNASGEDVELRLEILGLPGGSNPSYVDVREVLWTDSREGSAVATALSVAKKSSGCVFIDVPSGMTRQIWISFHPTNLAPGAYEGEAVLTRASSKARALRAPLKLHVYPIRFPDRPSLRLGGWDYTNRIGKNGVTAGNRERIVAYLREHFVDSPWATASVLPAGAFDDHGDLVGKPDAAQLAEWLQLWPDARQYCIAVGSGDHFAGSKIGSPEFEKKVRSWMRFWAEQITSRGLRPEQFLLLLLDEPRRLQQDEIIKAWAKAVRSAGTGVRIWEDPIHEDPYQADQEMMALCDVLSPNRWFLMSEPRQREYYLKRRELGSELALYSCFGPMQEMDPYLYCRLQAWSCWEYGAKSSYFWAFTGGDSSWNAYALEGKGYSPFFVDETSVVSGKHMEAIREGVEDYEYLTMLREAIAEAESRTGSDAVADRARRLLDEAAGRVMNTEDRLSYLWREKKDRSVADRVRVEVLETLVELQRLNVRE